MNGDQAFSKTSVHIKTLNLRFQNPPFERAFSKTSLFVDLDRSGEDGRRKRIKIQYNTY